MGISIDTIFTTTITILIFVIGHALLRWREKQKEKQRLEDIRVYLFTLLDTIPKAIENLIKVYDGLSKEIAERSHRSFGLGESHELYLDSFDKISSIDLFKVLITSRKASNRKDRSKHFKALVDTPEFLRLQNARVKTNFANFIVEYRKYEQRWRDNFDSVLRLFDEMLSHAKRHDIKKSQDPFLNELDNLFANASQKRSLESMYETEAAIVDPLKELCKKHIKDERALKLMPLVVNCRRIFEELINLKDLFSKQFQNEAEQLQRISKSLEEATVFFKTEMNRKKT